MALGDYQKTTFVNGGPPGISAERLNNNENKTAELDTELLSHKEEKATDAVLGHIKKGTGVSIDVNGVLRVDTATAWFKKGSSSFTDNDTAQTFADAFCTATSLVTIVITSATPPQGVWSVESAAGSFTITSTVAESADITFDYYIQKAVG